MDAFTWKFTKLYSIKSILTEEIIFRLSKQVITFKNSRQIISDRDIAFTLNLFQKHFFTNKNVKHILMQV